MSGQALAGDYTGATANLEAIARHYAGADVRVCWQPAQHWAGLARRTAGGLEILLNPAVNAADLGYVFFHELGHLVRGHCENVISDPPEGVAYLDPVGRLARMTPPEQAAWGAVIATREGEADAWAWDTLAAFEGRFGPFLRAIQ
jgi:hypothetical protein